MSLATKKSHTKWGYGLQRNPSIATHAYIHKNFLWQNLYISPLLVDSSKTTVTDKCETILSHI